MGARIVKLLIEDGTELGTAELPAAAPSRPHVVTHAGKCFRLVRADPPAVPAQPGAPDVLVFQELPSAELHCFQPATRSAADGNPDAGKSASEGGP